MTQGRSAVWRLWPRSLFWLLFLGPFFFVSYGLANDFAARQPAVGSIVFDWERQYMPFVPMLMLPYMSIDAFYALSLFLVRSAGELHRHALRLLSATVVSVACFFLHPLRFAFVRPAVDGFNGKLLEMLMQFDKPFNQAPSLHISLLILLWAHYARRSEGWKRWALHGWFTLIGLSVPLTWQHHLFDVIAGAFVGFGIWYALPDAPMRFSWRRAAVHPKLAASYLVAGVGCGAAAAAAGGAAWWLLWPAVSICLVALAYGGFGTGIFQKQVDGRRTLPATVLLLPYLAGAHLARWLQARRARTNGDIGGLSLVCWPGPPHRAAAVLDLCAELPRQRVFGAYRQVPMLDLVAPSPKALTQAMAALEALRLSGMPVYVHCALGRGRSAVVAAAWLLHTRRCATAEDAVAAVRAACPSAVLGAASLARLREWHRAG
jgi:protein-tyrosine phosphatase